MKHPFTYVSPYKANGRIKNQKIYIDNKKSEFQIKLKVYLKQDGKFEEPDVHKLLHVEPKKKKKKKKREVQ
jgi:hypothetical protein